MTIARRSSLALLASLAFAPAAQAATARKGKGAPLPAITIYHLEGRRRVAGAAAAARVVRR